MGEEERLKAKLCAIEALYAGTTAAGEQAAAGRARQRIIARLAQVKAETPVEWQFTSLSLYTRRLLIALARRYDLKPYRYRRQRHSTMIVKAPERFLREVFLPEFDRMVDVLDDHLIEVTERVLREAFESDPSEPPEREQARQIEAFAVAKKA